MFKEGIGLQVSEQWELFAGFIPELLHFVVGLNNFLRTI